MAYRPPNISGVEAGIVVGFMVILELFQLVLVVIPLVGSVFWFLGFCALNAYFLLRVGPSYLGGKSAGQKFTVTAVSAIAGVLPILSSFTPELTIQALAMFWFLKKEYEEYAAAHPH